MVHANAIVGDIVGFCLFLFCKKIVELCLHYGGSAFQCSIVERIGKACHVNCLVVL